MNLRHIFYTILGSFAVTALAACAQSDAPTIKSAADGMVAASSTYIVNLCPVYKVGQSFAFVSDGSYSQETSGEVSDGTKTFPIQDKSVIICHLEGEAEVLAIFTDGSIQKLSIIVKNMRQRGDSSDTRRPGGQGREREMFPAGTKLTVEFGDQKTTLIVDDRPFTDRDGSIALLLGLLDAQPSDREIFGPQNPVAVGANWPINRSAFLAIYDHWVIPQGQAYKDYIHIFKDAAGMMKLDSVTGSGDDRVSTVSGLITVNSISLPPFEQGFVADSSDVKITRNDVVPNTTKGTLKRSMTVTIKIDGHVSDKTNNGKTVSGKINGLLESTQSQVITFN